MAAGTLEVFWPVIAIALRTTKLAKVAANIAEASKVVRIAEGLHIRQASRRLPDGRRFRKRAVDIGPSCWFNLFTW
jgi:hypothetical protein